MPTPGERRALIFLASVAALGVAVRGWREFHPADPAALAGSRTALARQIEAVDSAIATTSSQRKPREATARSAPGRSDVARADRTPSAAGARGTARRTQRTAPPDTSPRDPRQAYWDRSAYFDSVRRAGDTLSGRKAPKPPRDSKATLSISRERASMAGGPPVDLDLADLDELAAIPMIGPALAGRIFSDRVENGPFGSMAELERIPGITHAFARRLEPFVTFSGSPRHGSAGERRPQSKKERRSGSGSRP